MCWGFYSPYNIEIKGSVFLEGSEVSQEIKPTQVQDTSL